MQVQRPQNIPNATLRQQGGQSSSTPSLGFQVVMSGVKKRFPRVSGISTEDLADLIERQENAKERRLVVIDVRPEEEYSISHIPSVVRVDPGTENMDIVRRTVHEHLTGEQPSGERSEPIHVVMYCSLGYRSSALAEKLQRCLEVDDKKTAPKPSSHGFPSNMHIYNLEGGLFKWAMEERELVDRFQQPTKFVHPYNIVFGQLLSKDRRRYEVPRA
ncbi:uncharacterized protein [Diadema antillarum]|uniref:uncharacterized protein n=1 Tax=Diadema antillarum TaxID=105358 RepID=UPI003A876DBC